MLSPAACESQLNMECQTSGGFGPSLASRGLDLTLCGRDEAEAMTQRLASGFHSAAFQRILLVSPGGAETSEDAATAPPLAGTLLSTGTCRSHAPLPHCG